MIETICSNCGNIRVFEDSYAGRKFKCPECGEVVEIKPTETKDVETKDETSNDLVETMVTKKRHELSYAEKKLADKEKKEQKKREKEDAKIEKELKERLENAVRLAKIERILAYVIPILYLLNLIYVIWFADTRISTPASVFDTISGLFLLVGWVSALRRVIKYTDHKKEWFGDKHGYVFTDSCIEATRRNIIRELYPKRYEEEQARQDAELQKSKIQLEKILYELDHPEEKE